MVIKWTLPENFKNIQIDQYIRIILWPFKRYLTIQKTHFKGFIQLYLPKKTSAKVVAEVF